MGLEGNSWQRALKETTYEKRASVKTLRARGVVIVFLVRVSVLARGMAVIVVVHQALRHVGEHLAGGERRRAGPFDAALLARGLEQIVPAELRRIAGDIQPLRERCEDQLADAPAVPAFAEPRELDEFFLLPC